MVIPKYVQELMGRSKFALGAGEPGYTIRIYKSAPYTKIPTLKAEVEQLQKWVERIMPEDDLGVPTMIVDSIPDKTHYHSQYAVVTIFDPIMQKLEKGYLPFPYFF